MTESTALSVTARERWVYRLGGAAAAGVVLLVIGPAPVLVTNPIPTTVLGHINQMNDNKLVGLIDLDVAFALSMILFVGLYVALFVALRRTNPVAATIGLGAGLASSVIYLAINPTLSFLYVSDQYAAATTDAQRAALLAAGEALWANYQGTGFAVAFVLSAVAILAFSVAMARSRTFNRWTAYIGLVLGVVMLVPPLPSFGTFGTIASYLSLLPLVVWNVLVAWRLFGLAAGQPAEQPKSMAVGRVS
ncbi:MAG TPA: DUF4386 family protein, partial [Candidatus Dormibacteraeota bacterium]|nr:DUF4386 family protein [Candidatus Dormibacteraeota bacterium]